MNSNSSGFFLVEALVVILLLGLSAAAITAGANWTALATNGVNQIKNIERAMEDIASAFVDNDAYCKFMLAGVRLNPGAAANAAEKIPALNYYNLQGEKQRTLIAAGHPLADSGVLVESIRLLPQVKLNNDIVVAELKVFFETKSILGPSLTSRSLPIYAVVKGNRVVACSASTEGSSIIKSRMCELGSDGFATYDPANDQCLDKPEVRWFKGSDSESASCGYGYKIAASPYNSYPDYIVCSTTNPNLTTIRSRTYTSGWTDDTPMGGVYEASVDMVTQTCHFSYPPTTEPAQTYIKCVSR